MNSTPEISIVMPCLNEAETIAICVRKALSAFVAAGVNGEVVIGDNGSTDGSQEIALREGARVIAVPDKGYGNALRGGIQAAEGRWILMGDADDSYDFSNIAPFLTKLRDGYDLVMGCRMPSGGGVVMPGAMPWKHRWIGNPILTFIGRLFFHCPAHDFHCGMRAFTKEAYCQMDPRTTGMEFASELVIKSTLKGLRIAEVPITLYPDGRSRPPHLRSWRDGWRHLRFMLLFSPRWLFLIPGMTLGLFGFVLMTSLLFGDIAFGKVVLDVGTMISATMCLIVGFQLVQLAIFSRLFTEREGLLPGKKGLKRFLDFFTLEWGVGLGALLCLIGGAVFGIAFWDWRSAGFQGLSYGDNLRRIIPAATLIILGVQLCFGSFFVGVLSMKTTSDSAYSR